MAKVLKLSAEEMGMKGAPEGELHLAAVMERFEVPEPNGDPATILARLRDQLATREGLHEWHEQFSAADVARGIIVYESHVIDKAAAKEVSLSTKTHVCSLPLAFLKCFLYLYPSQERSFMITFPRVETNSAHIYIFIALAFSWCGSCAKWEDPRGLF